ncbi:hypothetical protein QQP08_003068 [Theobroma cacao]|nr:hypothetical protein QQP08_003068 [Theobroma cacao]
MVRPMSTRKNTCSSGSFRLSGRKNDSRTAETCLFPWKIVREKEAWHQELQQHRHTRVRQESPILRATLSTLPLSNARFQVWKKMAQRTRVNAKNILMFTRNARKRRGKLVWNATRVAPSSHEIPFEIFFLISMELKFKEISVLYISSKMFSCSLQQREIKLEWHISLSCCLQAPRNSLGKHPKEKSDGNAMLQNHSGHWRVMISRGEGEAKLGQDER